MAKRSVAGSAEHLFRILVGATVFTVATAALAEESEATSESESEAEVAETGSRVDVTTDAVFVGAAAALGSGAGLLGVAATTAAAGYGLFWGRVLVGPYLSYRLWPLAFLGLVPVGLSLLCIPAGAAFATWWGAGIRGLPLTLVEAGLEVLLGVVLGALVGALLAGPAAVMGGALFFSFALMTGGLYTLSPGAAATALLVGPLLLGAAFTLPGALAGAAGGPIFTVARWGLGAEASYAEE